MVTKHQISYVLVEVLALILITIREQCMEGAIIWRNSYLDQEIIESFVY